MTDQLKNRFLACCLGASAGEAIGIPAEGMSPEEVYSRYGEIKDYHPRTETEEFFPLEAGQSARQTEALLAVLASSRPLPDLQEFAFILKQALNRYPEKWPRSTTFAWPPFPDGGHYTFSFALPAARLLHEGRIDTPGLVDWMQTLTPSSIVWQQSIWLYIRLLDHLFGQSVQTFDPDTFLAHAARFVREAEGHFPGEFKIRRRMQVTEPLMDRPLDDIARSCGKVSSLAEDMITFVGAVFYHHYRDMMKALGAAAGQGGASEASCFYLGSLFGALCGMKALPDRLISGYSGKQRILDAVDHFEKTLHRE